MAMSTTEATRRIAAKIRNLNIREAAVHRRYRAELVELEGQRLTIQAECPHPKTMPRGDTSLGSGDSYSECECCGARF
jgi:nitrite reductase/ring-hydroxylating ferredoxin subunit